MKSWLTFVCAGSESESLFRMASYFNELTVRTMRAYADRVA